jgi:acyl carrier protein phosphodiesterase
VRTGQGFKLVSHLEFFKVLLRWCPFWNLFRGSHWAENHPLETLSLYNFFGYLVKILKISKVRVLNLVNMISYGSWLRYVRFLKIKKIRFPMVLQKQSHLFFFFFSSLTDLEDSTSNFSQLFLVCFYVVTKLLAFAKPFDGNQLIVVSEILYWLVNKTFFFNFTMHF